MRQDTIPKKRLKVIANSPGEVLTWATILTNWFDVELLLTPCPFASGREFDYALRAGSFHKVSPPWSTFKLALLGRRDKYLREEELELTEDDLLLHLGGDLAYSALLAKRYRVRVISYIWGRRSWDKYIQLYIVYSQAQREELLRRGIPADKILKARDLVWEGIELAQNSPQYESFRSSLVADLGVMCGSREREVKYLIPLVLRSLEILRRRLSLSRLTINLPLSPLIPVELIERLLSEAGLERVSGEHSEGDVLTYNNEALEIRVLRSPVSRYAGISASRLILTIPGTKTHEVAHLGKPMLVILPLHKPEEIPVGGLPGLLDFLPFNLGKPLKRMLILKMERRFKYVALPNILANKEIVPEFRGRFSPEELATALERLITSPEKLSEITQNLQEIYSEFKDGPSIKEILSTYL